jgi:hypothetical protein
VQGSINDDIEATRLVGSLIDIMLLGNHEHPYFGGPAFSGFAHYAELQHALSLLNNTGLIQPALEVDGILLTHAGVTRDIDRVDVWHEGGDNKAREVANGLNTLWRNKDYAHAMFSCIGHTRGGAHPLGGVLWSDYSEPKSTLFPQIFGHTVAEEWRAIGSMHGGPTFPMTVWHDGDMPARIQTLCIDIGVGKCATAIVGAWIRDGEVEVVEYRQ